MRNGALYRVGVRQGSQGEPPWSACRTQLGLSWSGLNGHQNKGASHPVLSCTGTFL